MEKEKITSDELKIAEYRLEAMPAHLEVSLGKKGSYNKEELKKHLEKEDEVGKAYARVQMAGLRAFKEV